jgi:hypothetical protein
MTDLPKTIWARVKPTAVLYGSNREVGELREWCEGYATPEIAETCGAKEFIRTDVHATAKARIAELEAALQWVKDDAKKSNDYPMFYRVDAALKVKP